MVMFPWQLEDARRDIISNPMNLFPQNLSVLSATAHSTRVRLLIGVILIATEVVIFFIIPAVQVVGFRYFQVIPQQWNNFIWIFLSQWSAEQSKPTMVI